MKGISKSNWKHPLWDRLLLLEATWHKHQAANCWQQLMSCCPVVHLCFAVLLPFSLIFAGTAGFCEVLFPTGENDSWNSCHALFNLQGCCHEIKSLRVISTLYGRSLVTWRLTSFRATVNLLNIRKIQEMVLEKNCQTYWYDWFVTESHPMTFE